MRSLKRPRGKVSAMTLYLCGSLTDLRFCVSPKHWPRWFIARDHIKNRSMSIYEYLYRGRYYYIIRYTGSSNGFDYKEYELLTPVTH